MPNPKLLPQWTELRSRARMVELRHAKETLTEAQIWEDGFKEARRMIADFLGNDLGKADLKILVNGIGTKRPGYMEDDDAPISGDQKV